MSKIATIFLSLFFLAGSQNLFAQDLQVIVHNTSLTDTLGAEIVFDFEVINISQANQVVFEVRTINQLPESWSSSLCFGDNCFSPDLDSIATTPEFFTPELEPGDTLLTSLHVFTYELNGTANVQLQVGTFRTPEERITLDFVATTLVNEVKDQGVVQNYSLNQNYPNPFNPSTKISFNLEASSFVTLKVFNLLGEEVASLVNRNMNAGDHSVNFDAAKLNSGVYLYRLEANDVNGKNFTSVKKMILTK